LDPIAWERSPKNGCVSYLNKSEGPAKIRVITADNPVLEFEIPAGREIFVCGNVVHIDTKP
jgi:hypothetical protein